MHDGSLLWTPPAIYKFYCDIDLVYFPYDAQECYMKFGGWSHDGLQVDIDLKSAPEGKTEYDVKLGSDMREYTQSGSWDVTEIPAKKRIKRYPCCPTVPYPDIRFYFRFRRKTLFYTVTLTMPCVSISILTLLLYYLPSDSCEKVIIFLFNSLYSSNFTRGNLVLV